MATIVARSSYRYITNYNKEILNKKRFRFVSEEEDYGGILTKVHLTVQYAFRL